MQQFNNVPRFPTNSLYGSRTKISRSSNQSADYSGNSKDMSNFLSFWFWPLHLFCHFQAKSKKFRQLLVSWIKASGFSRTIVLSSSHAYQRDDQQLQRYCPPTMFLTFYFLFITPDPSLSSLALPWGIWSLRPWWKWAEIHWRSLAGGSWRK